MLSITSDHIPAGEGIARPVALVNWPADADRRADLASRYEPRILLVDASAPPPITWDDQEDWARLPVDDAELRARAQNLLRHASAVPTVPVLDADGIVRAGSEWVAVPPLEARLLAPLLHRPTQVVPREDLLAAGWPDGASDETILHGRIRMLRNRLEALGVRITNIRGVGFMLEFS